MENCNFCDFEKCSYEYFDKEDVTDKFKMKYGMGRAFKGGTKVFPCLSFHKTQNGKYQLSAMIEENSGSMNGTFIDINYCPICGRKLGESEHDRGTEE